MDYSFYMLKQNWIKIGIGMVILVVLFLTKAQNNNPSNSALIDKAISSQTPPPFVISENEQKLIELEKSLPRFEDYPVKIYPIPPKPKLVHESNPYGMRYWTVTENMASASEKWGNNPRTTYNMAGHY